MNSKINEHNPTLQIYVSYLKRSLNGRMKLQPGKWSKNTHRWQQEWPETLTTLTLLVFTKLKQLASVQNQNQIHTNLAPPNRPLKADKRRQAKDPRTSTTQTIQPISIEVNDPKMTHSLGRAARNTSARSNNKTHLLSINEKRNERKNK